jgi:hypothetical protein
MFDRFLETVGFDGHLPFSLDSELINPLLMSSIIRYLHGFFGGLGFA